MVKPLAKKKKDFRLLCKLFYVASPSLVLQGYKAGCNINKHDAPCKWCKRCKYGKPPTYEELARYVPIQKEVEKALNAGMSQKNEPAPLEYNVISHGDDGKKMCKVVFVCDRKKCEVCNPDCAHTLDLKHANNFELIGDVLREKLY